VKRAKAFTAVVAIALFGVLAIAPSSDAATAGKAGGAGKVSPFITHVACIPYNGWLKFDNTLGGECFANSGTVTFPVPGHYYSWCSGNNAGWFQWDAPNGVNVVTSFGKWQCGPLDHNDEVWTIHIN
jgi:hypothetical protein